MNDDAVDALEADVFSRACTSRTTLQNVTGRWGVLTLAALGDGTQRFGRLRRRVDGVSERMLSQTLVALERDGLVRREVLSAIPPHVEYSLTDLGRDVARHLHGLIEVVETNMPTVRAARERFDATRPGLPHTRRSDDG